MGFFTTDRTELSDEVLMGLVAKGDEQAFGIIYDRYSGRLMNYFHKMLWRDRERSEDMVQNIFLKIAKKPDSYDPKRPFSTWLFSVANNMCKNEYRREEVRRAPAPQLDIPTSSSADPTIRSMDHELFRERLAKELDTLDDAQRGTFVMRYYEDLSIKEIATVMDCSEGTVKSRLFYTLKKLAGRLSEFDPKKLTRHGN
jgi:RNA polymerase sigma-70 factor (ECF subfamily)